MSKKKYVKSKLCIVIILCVHSLMACSQSSEITISRSNQIKEEKATVVLKTVSMYGGTDCSADNYRQINEKFMEENQNVLIEDNSQTADQDWKEKIAADFAVGNEPDVIQYFTDANANDVLAADKFVTIEEIRKEYPEYASDTKLEALQAAANPDGILRAVPTTGYWEGIFCNQDLFDQYELELPYDWEQFLTAIKVFQQNDIIPIAVSLDNVPHYLMEALLLSSLGEENYSKVPTEVTADWMYGLSMIKTLRDYGAFPKDTDTIDNEAASELFRNKRAAMQIEGSWYINSIDDQQNTVVLPFPTIPGGKENEGAIVAGISNGFYITKKAWNDPDKREIAVQFVIAHTCKEAITAYQGSVGLDVVETDWNKEDFTELEQSGLEYGKSAISICSPTDARISPEAYSRLVQGIVDISTGELLPEELLKEVIEINNR